MKKQDRAKRLYAVAVLTGVIVETDAAILEKFVSFVEDAIKSNLTEAEPALSDLDLGVERDEWIALYDRYSDPTRNLNECFANTLRLWAFSTLWGTFVYRLKDMCRQAGHRGVRGDHLSEMSDRCLARARAHMKKELGPDYPNQELLWEELTSLNWLRRKILHSGATVRGRDTRTKEARFFLEHPELAYISKGQIFVQPQLLSHTVRLFRSFFAGLLTGMKEASLSDS